MKSDGKPLAHYLGIAWGIILGAVIMLAFVILANVQMLQTAAAGPGYGAAENP